MQQLTWKQLGERRRKIIVGNGAWRLSCSIWSNVQYLPTRATRTMTWYFLRCCSILTRFMSGHGVGVAMIFLYHYLSKVILLWWLLSSDTWPIGVNTLIDFYLCVFDFIIPIIIC